MSMINDELRAYIDNLDKVESVKGLSYELCDARYKVANVCLNQFGDKSHCFEQSKIAKENLEKLIFDARGYDIWTFERVLKAIGQSCREIELYYDLLKLESRDLLDSFCLYLEKNRKPEERFYLPRRKTLKRVVDVLQKLEDDELDEVFIHMPPRLGKLLADDTPVMTSKGWKNHGDLVVGDEVIGLDGNFTKVIAVHPKYHTTHTVTFADGSSFDCHENHVWYLSDRYNYGKYVNIETKDLIGKELVQNGGKIRSRFFLPTRPVIKGIYKDNLAVSPYVLGAWLGDGTNTKGCITSDLFDFCVANKILESGYDIKHTYIHKDTGVATFDFGYNLVKDLRTYGMCFRNKKTTKHIPEEYKNASIEQRLELLAGLLDTDGTLTKKEHRYHFSTTEEQLKDDVVELINSFGWRTSVVREEPKLSSSGIQGRLPVYTIGFNPTFEIPCVVERKQLKEFSKVRRIALKSVVESEHKQGNCITVENENGIYLVGKNYIPTHNSQMLTYALAWHCARDTNASNLYATYKEGAGSSFLDGYKEVLTDPQYTYNEIFPDAFIIHTDSKENTVDLKRRKKYKSLSCKGLTSGLNGLYDATGWLIADDILEGIQDVLSPEILHRKQIIFDNNLMSRKKSKCKVIYNGTIWSLHDIYSNRLDFLQNNPDAKNIRWTILKLPALDENDESNFNYDYDVGFDTQYYRTLRSKFEENDDLASWFAQYQQEPIERDGAVFNPDHMKFYNGVLPEQGLLKVISACDVALGGGDYLSMPIAYVYEDGSVYVHDVVYNNGEKHITQPEVVGKIIANNVTNAFFESNQGGEGYKDEVDRLLKEHFEFNGGKGIRMVSKYADTHKRKEQRIWDNAQTIREFYFLDVGHRSNEYRKFMTNLYSFTMNGKNQHEDAPDSLSALADFLKSGSGVATISTIHNPFRSYGAYGGYGSMSYYGEGYYG